MEVAACLPGRLLAERCVWAELMLAVGTNANNHLLESLRMVNTEVVRTYGSLGVKLTVAR